MKQYKLIKEYPGSPKLGTKCSQLENDTITAYPEYWEKVEELCVPVGTKFIQGKDKTAIFTIDSVLDNKCVKNLKGYGRYFT